MSATDPPRSALPLAAVGIACLGIVPAFGGPEKPLHWAMTAGMVGFGTLLWVRHGLSQRGGALRPVASDAARGAGRAVLLVCAVSAVLVLGIIALQWRRGGPLGLPSLAMPLVGLCWLATLGIQVLKHRDRESAVVPAGNDRPSRRPPQPGALPAASQRPSSPPTDRRVSA